MILALFLRLPLVSVFLTGLLLGAFAETVDPPAELTQEKQQYVAHPKSTTNFSTGLDADEGPVNRLDEVSLLESRLVFYQVWNNIPAGHYEYEYRVFDGAGQQVDTLQGSVNLKMTTWYQWVWHWFDSKKDRPGLWKFDVYLDYGTTATPGGYVIRPSLSEVVFRCNEDMDFDRSILYETYGKLLESSYRLSADGERYERHGEEILSDALKILEVPGPRPEITEETRQNLLVGLSATSINHWMSWKKFLDKKTLTIGRASTGVYPDLYALSTDVSGKSLSETLAARLVPIRVETVARALDETSYRVDIKGSVLVGDQEIELKIWLITSPGLEIHELHKTTTYYAMKDGVRTGMDFQLAETSIESP